jgi:hypothetical protein
MMPTVANPLVLHGNQQAPAATQEQEPPVHGSSISRTEMDRRKSLDTTKMKTGGREVNNDTTPSPLAPTPGITYNGLGENGWIPYDASIAVGPNHVLTMTNSQWTAYDRSGNTVKATQQFVNWWGTTAALTPFDPRCMYDAANNRFIMLTVGQDGTHANYYLSVTQTGDPTGAWYNYVLDATKDGSTSTTNWADFPGIGFDDNAIYITSNQFTLAGNLFQHAKIRVLSKAQLYSGGALTYTDFVSMKNADLSLAFTLKAARPLGPLSSGYLLNTNDGGGNYLTLWRIDNAPSSPTLTLQTTFTIGAYSPPPDAAQKGTSALISTGDSRTQEVIYSGGLLYTAFAESLNSLSALRYEVFNPGNNSVVKDITYAQAGTEYYYPAVTVDSAGNAYITFSRSSSTEYASMYQSGMTTSDTQIEPSAIVRAGIASNTSGRWGDYSGIANDPANSLQVLIYGGWGNSGNLWATEISTTTFSGSQPAPTLASVSPTNGTQGANVNVTLTGTNFISGATVNFSGAGVTVTGTTVMNSTTITATFNIAGNAATGAQNVSITTTGGTSGNVTFTVNPAPTLSSVSPNNGVQGNSVGVTLTGTNFVTPATVNFGGAGVTVTGTTVMNSTTITATFNLAANAALGAQNVSVTTNGVTTGNTTFTVNPPAPTLASINPMSGNQNAAVIVTLTGTNFVAPATINYGGSGVTISGTAVANSTTITATFTMASNAATGGQTVSVATAGGTSRSVTFTVNAAPPPPPTLSSVMPGTGVQGTSVGVTLTGTNFFAPATVNFGGAGVTVMATTVANSTTITATFNIAANAALGAQNVSVTTAGGTTGNATFTVNPPAPTLGSVSPSSNVQGAIIGVTLTGTNFISGATINLSGSGITASGVTVMNSTTITATFTIATNAPLGAHNVSVTTSAGTSSTVPFTVNAAPGAPTLTAPPSPQDLTQGNSFLVTLTGTNFVPGNTTVDNTYTGLTVSNVTVLGSTSMTATFTIAANAPVGTAFFTVTTPGGRSNQKAVDVIGVPILNTISPANANPGTSLTVTLSGSKFLLAQVQFSGTGITATNRTVNSPLFTIMTYTFTIASNATPGPQTVTLTNVAGTSNGVTFAVNGSTPAPTLSNLSPSSGQQGQVINPITLTGTNFVAPATVNFGGAGVTVTGTTVTNSTTITATFNIAANATLGAQNVSVTTSGGTSGNATFTVNPPAPTLTSLSQTTGVQGTSVGVTLTGTNFVAPATVNFGGAGVTVTGTTVVNSTTITATFNIAANAALGAQNVSVTTSGGTSGNATFTVNPPAPTLTSLSQTTGVQGTNPGVTLTGTNFVAPATVNFGGAGVTVTGTTVVNSTTITATFNIAANAALGAQNVSVTTSGGTSGNATFTVNPPAPTLTSLGQTTGVQGTNVSVTLTGTNFVAPATVNFGGAGVTVTGTTVVNSTTITATFNIAANAALGAQNVSVTAAGGTSGNVAFTVNPPVPTLTSISPSQLILGNAATFTLTGTNFVPGNTTINNSYPGLTVSNISVASSTSMTATFAVAANAQIGSAFFSVTTAGGTSGTRGIDIIGVPILNSISPASGARGSSFTVTLSGSQLSLGQIQISGTGITATNRKINTPLYTMLTYTFTIAANAPTGPQSVTVTNPAGTSAAVTFTVN